MKEPIHLRCTIYDLRFRNLARLRLAGMRSVSEGGGWNYARRWLQSGGDGGGWRRPEADRVCLCTMEDVRFGL